MIFSPSEPITLLVTEVVTVQLQFCVPKFQTINQTNNCSLVTIQYRICGICNNQAYRPYNTVQFGVNSN